LDYWKKLFWTAIFIPFFSLPPAR